MFTLENEGIAVQTLEDTKLEIAQEVRDQFKRQDLDTSSADSGIGNTIAVWSEREYQRSLRVRDVYAATTPEGATGQQATNLALLTGTVRPGATFSTVVLKLRLEAGATVAAGKVFRNPDDQYTWATQAAVTNSGGTTDDFPVLARCNVPGPVRGNAHTITEPVSTIVGLVSCDNDSDATMGRNAYSDPELMILRQQELAASGTSIVAALDGALRKVSGVLNVNIHDPDDGSIDCVIWDGVAHDANDDEIAQVIIDKTFGILSIGSESGTAVDFYGANRTVAFDRADERDIYLAVFIKVGAGFPVDGDTQIKNAIVAFTSTEWTLDTDNVSSQLVPVVFGISGVVDVPTINIGIAPFPSSPATIVNTFRQVGVADTSRISVTHV